MQDIGHLGSRNESIVRDIGHFPSRNESIVRDIGHGQDEGFHLDFLGSFSIYGAGPYLMQLSLQAGLLCVWANSFFSAQDLSCTVQSDIISTQQTII